jgi:hypothetical protein
MRSKMVMPMAKMVRMGAIGQGLLAGEGRQVVMALHRVVKVEDMVQKMESKDGKSYKKTGVK